MLFHYILIEHPINTCCIPYSRRKLQANDLNELKKLQKPSDVIKLIFDCVGLLKMEKVQPVQVDEITIGIGKEKQTLPFLKVQLRSHQQ